MTITAVTRQDTIKRLASSLHVPGDMVSVPLIAQALRRAIHILAPCPRHELERAVCKSMIDLGVADEFEALVKETTEALLVYGDILEMRPLEDDLWRESPIVLRPAPPSFIVRQDGTAVIVGVAGDEITPFVGETNARVVFRGPLRLLSPKPQEDLPQTLRELGLLELSEAAWLRLPPVEPANTYVARWVKELAEAQRCAGAGPELRVVAPAADGVLYRDRWTEPASTYAGMHVARRPQKYGPDVWCLVDLECGRPARFIDLHSRGDRLRPCDIAWRIQLAIDAQAGTPQPFRIRRGTPEAFMDFLSPLPSWATRKLTIAGQRADPFRSIISFSVPASDLTAEVEFLQQRLWLQPDDTRAGGGTP